MALFRRKKTEAAVATPFAGPLSSVVTHLTALDLNTPAFTATEAANLVRNEVNRWGSDFRIYLILSNEVRRDGTASEWEFHVLFPTLRAEGKWYLKPSDTDETKLELSSKMAPVPEPGTTEYLMAQVSPQIARDQQLAWDDRLTLIAALPDSFVDSPAAVAAIERVQPQIFLSGPIRLKARRLPTGNTVWENRGVDLIHMPFRLDQESASETAAFIVNRQTYE